LEQSFTAHMPLLMAAIRLREKFSSVVLPALSLYHLDLSCLTHTHTQPFYGPFSGTTQVSWCQKRHRPSGWAPLHPN